MRRFFSLLVALFVFGAISVLGQTRQVTGKVVSADGKQPIPGVSVYVKEAASVGTTTNVDGQFMLRNLPTNAKTIVFRFVGFKTQEVPITSGEIIVTLESEAQKLDEVVVTAMGISREKKSLGYSVSEVKGDEMLKSRGGVSNPINSLQGKVAGLQIAGGSGSMGGSSKVLIRGVNSISGNNQPLFVVDGVPIEGTDFNSTNTQRGAGGYDYGNLIQDINPDDIENISVLKGPNASALYGSRAANGVVMITTKKAKVGTGYNVSVNSSVGFEVVNKLPKLQRLYGGGTIFEDVEINGNTYRYPDYYTDESWGDKYDGKPFLSWYDLAKWEAGGKQGSPTTSVWQAPKYDVKDFFNTGVSYTNNVSVSEATDRSSVRLSFTNSILEGYMPNSSLKKNIFSVAASTTSANKKLEVFTNVTYFNSRAKGRSETGYGDNNVMQKFVQWGHRELDMRELKSLYIMPDGTQATWNRYAWDDPTPAYSNNPYWTRYKNYQNDSRNRVYGNVGASYKITDDLKLQYKANLDFFVDKQYERNAVYSQELSRYMEISRQQYELNNEFMLMFNKTISDFNISANVGGNFMHRNYEYVYGETSGGLSLPDLYNLVNSRAVPHAYNYGRKKSINSVFGNINAGWRSMLFLDFSLRNDWSSSLPQSNNSYIYPSITGSFVFSEMLKDSFKWMNYGKLRVGYAMVGNDTDPYQIVDTYRHYTRIDPSASGYVLNTKLNFADLKPESTTSFEIGLEMAFLNNRINFEGTYYSSETKDQILALSTSGVTGYTYKVVNSGVIGNKGIELSLTVVPVKTSSFTWTSTITLASNKNKVKELLSGVDYYRLVAAPFRVEVGARKGESYGTIMGTDFVYDSNGNKVVGSNGMYLSTSGNVKLGNIYPDFTGGWSNTFTYKGIDLSILVDFSKGGNFFSTSYMWGMYSGMLEETAANNIREDGIILDGVKQDGTKNDKKISAVTWASGFNSGPAAQSILKSDYVKLREVNLGYTIPLNKEFFIKNLRVAAYGRNLKVWGSDTKHFDPEMIVTGSGNIQGIEGAALPSVANFGFNLSLKF